jgi:hypothetical protein
MPSPEGWEQRQEALGESDLGRYVELQSDWEALLGVLREEPRFGLSVVAADTVAVLNQWFTQVREWREEPDRWGLLGGNGFGVAWSWRGAHDIDRAFNGLPATDLPVTVQGFTVLGPEPERRTSRVVIRRYIDWAGLFAQLGLTLNWRIPMPPDPDLYDDPDDADVSR